MLQNECKKQEADGKVSLYFFTFATLAIVLALILTVLSLMELCTTACVEGHDYRLFNLKFEHAGAMVVSALLCLHLYGRRYPLFSTVAGYFLGAAVGAELYFLYLQKYIIGHWCPICLGIATSIFTAAFLYALEFFMEHQKNDNEGGIMSRIKISFPPISFILIGMIVAIFGVTKVDPLVAAQASIKDNIAFGAKTSPIEVYVFTDWFCPACEAVEPRLKEAALAIEKEAKLYFIDANIHEESINFTPYNLSFMIYNKPQYFELRYVLHQIAAKTKSPTDVQIKEAIKPFNIELKELNYMDIALGNKMFTKLKKQFGVSATPTVIVINLETKKGKKLSGKSDITETNLMKAITTLKTH